MEVSFGPRKLLEMSGVRTSKMMFLPAFFRSSNLGMNSVASVSDIEQTKIFIAPRGSRIEKAFSRCRRPLLEGIHRDHYI